MPINLTKGQKVDLTKGNPSLSKIIVGLGWDVNTFDSGADFDLDAAVFMTGADGKCPSAPEFIFYGNLEHPSGAVKHMGDNLTGEGDGDDEQITVDLTKIPANVERIAFTVTIYDAETRRQNFGQVSNAYIHIQDMATGQIRFAMIWARTSRSKQRSLSVSCTAITANGSLTPLEAASRAVWLHCAVITELKWNKRR